MKKRERKGKYRLNEEGETRRRWIQIREEDHLKQKTSRKQLTTYPRGDIKKKKTNKETIYNKEGTT